MIFNGNMSRKQNSWELPAQVKSIFDTVNDHLCYCIRSLHCIK